MKNEKLITKELLLIAAIFGNILFVLWILYNGINEGFQGSRIEKVSYTLLIGVLLLNSFLLITFRKQLRKKE